MSNGKKFASSYLLMNISRSVSNLTLFWLGKKSCKSNNKKKLHVSSNIIRFKQVYLIWRAFFNASKLILRFMRGMKIIGRCRAITEEFSRVSVRSAENHYFIADEALSSGNRGNNCPPWPTRSRRYPIVRRILARDTRYFSSSRIFGTFAYCDHPVVSRMRSLEHT